MTRTTDNLWLHRFAIVTAAAALLLIGLGGLVTSHEAGLAVPDWPTTYGYNMFLFPPSQWMGGIFYEHTHRLFASWVGLLTTILAIWLWLKESRAWVRWWGVAAFLAVVLQGVLGGLRVVLFQAQLGIVHAALAQLFLVLVSALAVITSRWWREVARNLEGVRVGKNLQCLLVISTGVILIQLVLGATMRHQHAGLAVPDFPLAYGKIWPPTDPASLEKINRTRMDIQDYNPITAFQIRLHLTHRLWAVLILVLVGISAPKISQQVGPKNTLSRLSTFWFGLVLFQAVLGAATVWSNKSADVATSHVVVGALCLVLGSTLTLMVYRCASVAGKKFVLPDSEKVYSSSELPRDIACTAVSLP